jgi:anthranilate phosphoribosyltransferase
MNIQNHQFNAATNPASKSIALDDVLQKLIRGEHLSREQASALLDGLLDPQTSDLQIAEVLTALAKKGETAEELTGMASAMRARMIPLSCEFPNVIDTAGTGASKAKTFNVSTAAAFVIAAAGLPIAKHGAKAATSNSGSADVLHELGIDVQADPSVSARSLAEHHICFLFAPQYHPAAARVAHVRRELGFRTVFNLIGPLSSPSRAKHQVLGVGDSSLQSKMAEALANLGCTRGWVVYGEDGLDEISLATPTRVAEIRDGRRKTFTVSPETFGIHSADCSHLRAETAAASARQTLAVLNNTADRCATDLVILNAAAALVVGLDLDPSTAADLARSVIVNGAALAKLETLRSLRKEQSA